MVDTSNSPAISIRNVAKSFGKGVYAIRVLDDVSLDIGRREFFTLLGPSGCGKTTLLRLIAGFERSDSGSIAIEGPVAQDGCDEHADRLVPTQDCGPKARELRDRIWTRLKG